jgi:hypothetical protein
MKRIAVNIAGLLILASFFVGCIESPMQQESYVINGKIYDYSLMGPYLVSVGDYPIITANQDGIFKIQNSITLYNLIISHLWHFGYPIIWRFNNVSIDNLHIVTNEINFPYIFFDYYQACETTVNFPPLESEKIIGIGFISGSKFESEFQVFGLPYGSNSLNYSIYVPSDVSSITGRIYYLEMTPNPFNGWIESYDKYGIKNVTLLKNANNTVTFSEEEISYNPVEQVITVDIKYPADFYVDKFNLSLSVPSEYKASDLALYSRLNNSNQYIVPKMPGNEFKIKTQVVYHNDFWSFNTGKQWKLTAPTENTTLVYSPTVNLSAPEDDAQNVTETTRFEITDSDTPALYEFNFHGSKLLKFYTNKNKFILADFKTRDYEFFANGYFVWYVRKFPGYDNIDEFLSQPYVIDNKYDYIELTRSRNFTTAP